MHVCGTLEFVNQYVPILEPAGHRPSTDEPPRTGPMTAVATKFGWAADVIDRRPAADAVSALDYLTPNEYEAAGKEDLAKVA